MLVGPKTRQFFQAKRNPVGSAMEFMMQIQAVAAGLVKNAVSDAIASTRGDLDAKLSAAYAAAMLRFKSMPDELMQEQQRLLRARIDAVQHIKGDPGYTPQKGVDYFDGENGDDGETPVAGEDYPTLAQMDEKFAIMMDKVVTLMEEKGLTKEQIIEQMKDPAAMARALEALPEKDKLDYVSGLKNKPQKTDTKSSGKNTLHRGGSSKQTYYYDLSSLCDGNTRTFAIPANTRVVSVSCTDAPSGVYRPLIDWSGSGSILLTLSNDVAAPSIGATLYILYVV